jgi:adenylate kinase
MRILVTGVSGLERERAWSHIKSNFDALDLGNIMLDIARERKMDLDEQNILRADRDTLAALRAAAIARSVPRLPLIGDSSKVVVISAHSVFARSDGLHEGLLAQDLEELSPELWITLIDGPQAIEDRLKEHEAEYFHLSVAEVVKWQELEVFYSHHLAGDRGVLHYVVPVTQPEVFSAIAKGDRRQTAYASYPMSHAAPEVKATIDAFVEKLKDYFIVFDPKSIESSHGMKDYYTQEDRRAIGSHTIVRDLDWFIRINADAVVAYWPAVVFSSGMSDELRFAHGNGKKTILVTERQQGGLPLLSPFFTYKATVFWGSEEFFKYLALPALDQRSFLICLEVMVEQFRLHDAGGATLTSSDFDTECRVLAKRRLGAEDFDDVIHRLGDIAALVYNSWRPLLEQASRRGVRRQTSDLDLDKKLKS